ncbi:peptidoglycan editing factor PgeF [bacterium]|nr:peptidoglycan editing factor PgeF [bacterium]
MGVHFGWTEKPFGSAERTAAEARPRAAFMRCLAERMGLPPGRFVWMDQVHGDRVRRVGGGSAGGILAATDGCVTTQPELVLCIRTADCLPILLFDARGRAVAAVHAGWRGLLAGILGKAVTSICRAARCGPKHIRAVIGPCIHVSCYEVGEEVRRSFAARHGSWTRRFFRKSGTRLKASLPGIAGAQLKTAGIPATHIRPSRHCTACDSSRYFSFRARSDRGRFASFIFISTP